MPHQAYNFKKSTVRNTVGGIDFTSLQHPEFKKQYSKYTFEYDLEIADRTKKLKELEDKSEALLQSPMTENTLTSSPLSMDERNLTTLERNTVLRN